MMKRFAIGALSIVLSFGLGCTIEQHYPLSQEKRALLGKSVGVIAQPVTVGPSYDTKFMHYRSDASLKERLVGSGHQAAKSAIDGAKSGAYVVGALGEGGCRTGKGCALVLAVALATTISGATVGGVAGAISGILAGEVEIQQDVAAAINQAGIPQTLEEAILATLAGVPTKQFSRIVDLERYSRPSGVDDPDKPKDLEIDSIIELSLKRMAFVGTSSKGPHHLSIDIEVRVFKEYQYSPHRLLATRNWTYNSDTWSSVYTLEEWQADDARLLSDTIAHFSKQIAGHIKSEFFTCPTSYRCGEQTPLVPTS